MRSFALLMLAGLLWVAPAAAEQNIPTRVDFTFNAPDVWGVMVPVPPGATKIVGVSATMWTFDSPAAYMGLALWHFRTAQHELYFAWRRPRGVLPFFEDYAKSLVGGHDVAPGDAVWVNAWCAGTVTGQCTATVSVEFLVP